MKTYTRIDIKSENDLPKEDGIYYAHSKVSGRMTEYSFHNNNETWIECIDWYLIADKEPIEESKFPTKQNACDECNKFEGYSDPETLQSKVLNRKELQETAYANGFLNCYDWVVRTLGLNAKNYGKFEPEKQEGEIKLICKCDRIYQKVKEAWTPDHRPFEEANQQPDKPSVDVKSAPLWYTKQEMKDWLILNNYSKEIATELSEKWANDLQGAFQKGWDKRGYEIAKPEEPQRKGADSKLQSIEFIKQTRELISLGDKINIKARLIHLERMILEDIEYAQQAIEVSDEEINKEAVRRAKTNMDFIREPERAWFEKGAKWYRDQIKGTKE